MSQPVKLSDALVLDARIAGEAQERSIAGQVEFWAKLGRSLDLLLEGRQVLALRRSAGTQPLSEALASVDTPAGRRRVANALADQPFPHYKQHSGQRGLLVRTDEDGKQTVGRFANRVFVEMEAGNRVTKDPIGRSKTQDAKKSLRIKTVPVRRKAKSVPQTKKEHEACA
jgi:hypothetical protein